MGAHKYKAFISYSHKDRKWATWLHKRLEHYRFPKHLMGQPTQRSAVPQTLKPIFRDREELSAAENLGETIEAALSQSENLIVICSPNAAQSHWVNQEVCYFKSQNPTGRVFSIIIDGEPFANISDNETECLPPALRFDVDAIGQITSTPAEPLAADLRPEGDGKRLGLLKLISGMADLGLDDLVQRDLKRARHRVIGVTATAASIVLSMGWLSWLAVDASRIAETRKGQAENLIEYMIGDLKDKLEPVGRVDVLDGVAGKVIDYYDSYEPHEIDCDARSRRAHALHVAAEVSMLTDNMEEFSQHANNAYDITKANLGVCKGQENLLFDHGQSAFWRGYVSFLKKDHENTLSLFSEYRDLAEEMVSLTPDNRDKLSELGSANVNLGVYHWGNKDYNAALSAFKKAESVYRPIYKSSPNDLNISKLYAETVGWKALVYWAQKQISDAKSEYIRKLQIERNSLKLTNNKDWDIQFLIGTDYRILAQLNLTSGNIPQALVNAKLAEKTLKSLTQHDSKNASWQKELAKNQLIILHILEFNKQTAEYETVRQRFDATLKTFHTSPEKTERELITWLKLEPLKKEE